MLLFQILLVTFISPRTSTHFSAYHLEVSSVFLECHFRIRSFRVQVFLKMLDWNHLIAE